MFGEFLKVNSHRSPFRRLNFWEWREDALTITGGQDAVVRQALDHARIAIFIFKERDWASRLSASTSISSRETLPLCQYNLCPRITVSPGVGLA